MAERNAINYLHFFNELLEALPWPTVILDTTLYIHRVNQRAVQLFGTTGSLQGIQLDQVMHDPLVIQLVQESIQTGSQRSGEPDKSNHGSAWKISVTPLQHRPKSRKQGRTTSIGQGYEYFALVIEDLSELRRLERVRRDFIANISHELRTPLASVRLLVETLEEAIDTDPDMAQTFVEKIEIEVQYLTGLVSELLELSRIESGQVSMQIEAVGAEQLVRETMARMLPQAQRHRVALRTEIQQGATLVAADSKQIARVFVNLVHNAIKFTPSGGTIVIGTTPQEGGRERMSSDTCPPDRVTDRVLRKRGTERCRVGERSSSFLYEILVLAFALKNCHVSLSVSIRPIAPALRLISSGRVVVAVVWGWLSPGMWSRRMEDASPLKAPLGRGATLPFRSL